MSYTVRLFLGIGHERMEIGHNVVDATDAWDLARYTVFASRADLEAYQTHPSNLAINALEATMRAARTQVDFELPVNFFD